MSNFRVEGGYNLSGSIKTSAGKNSPIAILFASLLVRGVVTLRNISHVAEIDRVLEMLESVGVVVRWVDSTTLRLDTTPDIDMDNIDRVACRATRVALLFLGALATRKEIYKIYKSGGCELGERTVRPHLYALNKFGIQVTSVDGYYDVYNDDVKANDIVMYEAGDTATENAILAATLAPGKSTIKFASANYMVQDMCHFLCTAGAQISGIGTSTITVSGVTELHSDVSYDIMPDPVDAMAWVSLGITTGSTLTVEHCPIDFIELELEHLKIMGQSLDISEKYKSASGHFDLVDIGIRPSALTALPDKLHPLPYPGINIDSIPLFVPILAKAEGASLVHDWVYENRAIYYLELQKLGVKMILLDPHRVIIEGPSNLVAGEITCPPAIRPGMAILITMLAAKGTSLLSQVYPIDRAYDNLLERLQSVGAHIMREG
jgi:UDP-N-acetylglucosamine 1-carboxyvinyltransferase